MNSFRNPAGRFAADSVYYLNLMNSANPPTLEPAQVLAYLPQGNVSTCQRVNVPTSSRLGNRNALKHGLYAVKNRPPLAEQLLVSPAIASGPDASMIDQTIQAVRQKLLDHLLNAPDPGDFRAVLSWDRPILKSLKTINKLRLASWRRHYALRHLRLAAEHPLELLHWGFHHEGITRAADSFRDSSNQAAVIHASSPNDRLSLLEYQHLPGLSAHGSRISTSNVSTCQRVNVQTRHRAFTFLTDTQWSILEPLLPQSKIKNPQSSTHRGRPETNPRLLLDLIFIKLAHHLTWPDLQLLLQTPNPKALRHAHTPPSVSWLTVRRYYRRLHLSGRLHTLLKALYQDFTSNSGITITALLDQGLFTYSGHEILLTRDSPRTWQTRTALLFLQQSWHLSSTLLLEIDRRNNPRSPLCHSPSLPLNDFPFIYPQSILSVQPESINQQQRPPWGSSILNPKFPSSFLQQHKLSDLNSASSPFDSPPWSAASAQRPVAQRSGLRSALWASPRSGTEGG